MPRLIFTFPKLFGECQTGKTKIYKVSVQDNGDSTYSILREHGQLNGKTQIDEKKISEGKNIGRANQTTVRDQALSEAQSYYQKKLDSNYVEDISKAGNGPNLLPMLAQKYSDSKHRLIMPCYGQPKLNGVRCLARRENNNIYFTSRKNKPYDNQLQHLVPSLLEIMKDGDIFDGEVYIHGLSLQETVSYVKRQREESLQLRYHVYDIADTNLTFEERNTKYQSMIPDNHELIIKVPTADIADHDSVKPVHDLYVQEGYEGLMLRNKSGKYLFEKRSADLQKYKCFLDDEATVLGGVTPSTGRYAGCVVFNLITSSGVKFDACPRGTVEIRKKYYQDLPKLIGKKVTYRYQELSKDGTPLFPVVVCCRDYE